VALRGAVLAVGRTAVLGKGGGGGLARLRARGCRLSARPASWPGAWTPLGPVRGTRLPFSAAWGAGGPPSWGSLGRGGSSAGRGGAGPVSDSASPFDAASRPAAAPVAATIAAHSTATAVADAAAATAVVIPATAIAAPAFVVVVAAVVIAAAAAAAAAPCSASQPSGKWGLSGRAHEHTSPSRAESGSATRIPAGCSSMVASPSDAQPALPGASARSDVSLGQGTCIVRTRIARVRRSRSKHCTVHCCFPASERQPWSADVVFSKRSRTAPASRWPRVLVPVDARTEKPFRSGPCCVGRYEAHSGKVATQRKPGEYCRPVLRSGKRTTDGSTERKAKNWSGQTDVETTSSQCWPRSMR